MPPSIDPLTGMVARPAPATIRPWRDASGLTPREMHAALSRGETLRMALEQYVAAITDPNLEPREADDLAIAYRKHDITIRGR